MKPKILWIGDAVVSTGFARVTHSVCGRLHELGWDVSVIGVNYDGDPHNYPYPIWPAAQREGHDLFGVARFPEIAERVQPDVVVVLNDPWNVSLFLETEQPVPICAYMPVDAPNMATAAELNKLALAIFYTQFGQDEAHVGGYTGRSVVIPHGVDVDNYRPIDREFARERMGLSNKLGADAFIVGNVNRNQPRKRLDLSVMWFADWWKRAGQPNAYLYLHCATKDHGWDLMQLAKHQGIADASKNVRRLIVTDLSMSAAVGVAEESMPFVYNALDVQINTGLGEGWGLTAMEGMACGVPQILPDYAAFGEWARGAASLVPVTSYAVTPKHINTIGGIADRELFIDALDELFADKAQREYYARQGLALVREPQFRWRDIGEKFDAALRPIAEEKRHARELSKQAASHGHKEVARQTGSETGTAATVTA